MAQSGIASVIESRGPPGRPNSVDLSQMVPRSTRSTDESPERTMHDRAV
jgi:hypothetical protein